MKQRQARGPHPVQVLRLGTNGWRRTTGGPTFCQSIGNAILRERHKGRLPKPFVLFSATPYIIAGVQLQNFKGDI